MPKSKAVRASITNFVIWSLRLFVIVIVPALSLSAKERQYPFGVDLTWQASLAVLQERGESIVHSDKATGIITTDYRSEILDEEARHKFSLRVSASGPSTSMVSVTSVVDTEGKFGLSRNAAESDGTREAELLEAILQRLDPASPGPNLASPACVISFHTGGSVLRGTSYMASEEFAAVTAEALAVALKTTFAREGLALQSVENNSFMTQGSIGKRAGELAQFTLTPTAAGVRLSMTHKLPVAVHGRDDLIRDQICKVFGGVGRLTRKPIAASAASNTSDHADSIEERLKHLDELRKKGVITEDEYKQKRAELINKL